MQFARVGKFAWCLERELNHIVNLQLLSMVDMKITNKLKGLVVGKAKIPASGFLRVVRLASVFRWAAVPNVGVGAYVGPPQLLNEYL